MLCRALSAVWRDGKDVVASAVTREIMQLKFEWHVHRIYEEAYRFGIL